MAYEEKRDLYKTYILPHEYDRWMETIRNGGSVPPEVIGILLGRAKVVFKEEVKEETTQSRPDRDKPRYPRKPVPPDTFTTN